MKLILAAVLNVLAWQLFKRTLKSSVQSCTRFFDIFICSAMI